MGRKRIHEIGYDRRAAWKKKTDFENSEHRKGYRAGYARAKAGKPMGNTTERSQEYQEGYASGYAAGIKNLGEKQ